MFSYNDAFFKYSGAIQDNGLNGVSWKMFTVLIIYTALLIRIIFICIRSFKYTSVSESIVGLQHFCLNVCGHQDLCIF